MAFYDQWPKRKKILVAGAAFLVFGSLASRCGETQQEKAAKAASRSATQVAARPPAPVPAPVPQPAPAPPPAPLDPKQVLDAKIAALVAETVQYAKYEFKAGALSVTMSDDTEYEKMSEVVVNANWVLSELANKGFSSVPELKTVLVTQYAKVLDARGNAQRFKAGEFFITKGTAAKINWAKFDYANLISVGDRAWVQPGVNLASRR